MVPNILHSRKMFVLILVALGIKIFSLQSGWVERWYASGIYSYLSQTLRFLFGRVPFSIGDLVYAAAVIYLIIKLARFVSKWRKQSKKVLLLSAVKSTLQVLLIVYILFEVLWGLNYSRNGIAAQTGLGLVTYSKQDLEQLAAQLQSKLAATANMIDTSERKNWGNRKYMEQQGKEAYQMAQRQWPFLQHKIPSLKPSLFSGAGHLFGFTGYYNPFTGEAQIKTSIPQFLKPFVLLHEMGHQIGYAKESEANFAAYLSGRESANAAVRYSVYFEMLLYTLSDLRRSDTASARRFKEATPRQVQRDFKELTDYLERSRNVVEPYISRFYDAYLRVNSQPKGTLSYNEVVGWLIAYGKQWGFEKV